MDQTNAIVQWIENATWLQWEIGGNHLWQYLAFLVYVLFAIALSQVADIILSRYLTAIAAKTKTRWDDVLIKVLHGPLRLVVFIFFIRLGVQMLETPPMIHRWIIRTFGLIAAIAITYFVMKVVDAGFELLREKYARTDRQANLEILVVMRKTLKFFVLLIAALVTADNNDIKITSVLTGLGVTGLAVALAAQETLSNLLGSIVILADRPFRLGDRIKVGADEGVVEYIGVRSTRLRTPEGDAISIPNRNLTGMAVRNFSRTPPPAAAPAGSQGKPVA